MIKDVQYRICGAAVLMFWFLQPYAGEERGAWYAFVHEKPRMTIEAFFGDINDQRNHVSPEEFLRQLNAHGGYSFQSLNEAEYYFTTSTTVHVKRCPWDTASIPPGMGIMRTNADGTQFDVWRREGRSLCHEGEWFVYDDDVPVFSLYCGNVITSPRIGVVQKEPTFVSTMACVKRITPSYRSSYVNTSGFDHGGIGVGATRSGALIENECFEMTNQED